jgi:tetratricopeptide (TPR) repeat protein
MDTERGGLAVGGELRLEVQDYTDNSRWRWVLTDEAGNCLADHKVRLNTADWQFEAFADLTEYLSWHIVPDRRRQDESRIVKEVGEWTGSRVLGPVAAALAARRPTTVRVVVPAEARELLYRPLELAHADGMPLSVQDVTLFMNSPSTNRSMVAPIGARLRVLGLFSLPDGGQPLNLRRERRSLVRLIRGITATRRAADVRVLQYGVTRDRLRDVLAEPEGWDIIHISGHGRPGELLLETAAGKPDRISGVDLADLLDLARDRVKLVTVAACWSAAITANEQRQFLGLPVHASLHPERSRPPATPTTSTSGALATQLTQRLGCAVLAMRYPVADQFAIELTTRLYELIAGQAQPLPQAVALTLRQLSTDPRFPALSIASPALFGESAATLVLPAPPAQNSENPNTDEADHPSMFGFVDRPEPDRFVGRSAVMAKASEALAAGSGIAGVLLHGMPGGGKTACALELAYTHEHTFERIIWYKAPDEGIATEGALTDFTLLLEQYLPGLQMAHLLVSAERLAPSMPRLTEFMERHRLLLIIDNAESLLSENGEWCDERWDLVIRALKAHQGLGRLILTSRHLPAVLTGMCVQPIDALSPDEALLLARELPNLQALIRGEVPGIESNVAQWLARRALEVARGHPKLLELAEAQAKNSGQLAELVEAGQQEWLSVGHLPDGFFEPEGTTASGADYMEVLAAWTNDVARMLTHGERDFFWFLCCLEESDRQRTVVTITWPRLWNHLDRDGEPPSPDRTLAVIANCGLVKLITIPPEEELYAIHPGVAAGGRAEAGRRFRGAADHMAAAFWNTAFQQALEETSERIVNTRLLIRAGMAAAPYLMRQKQWDAAARLLELAFSQDPSRKNAAAVLPAITQLARHNSRSAVALAAALEVIDPVAAEAQLRIALKAATGNGNYREASVAAGRLVRTCLDGGRLSEALALTQQKADYTRQANLGPWSQLADACERLQVQSAMGQSEHVLAEVYRLRDQMDTLPASIGPDDTFPPWLVREMLFDVGCNAAVHLSRWDNALELNAGSIASLRERGAAVTNIARARFNDYGPLLSLERGDEAMALLKDCRKTFEAAHDIEMLGKTLGALAAVEDHRGNGDAALLFGSDALRYSQIAGNVIAIAASYHNLGCLFLRHACQPARALPCHLAAGLIRALSGTKGNEDPVSGAAVNLHVLGTAAVPPTDVADLCRQVDEIPGADLHGLIPKLSPDPEAAERALRDIVARAQELATHTSGQQ